MHPNTQETELNQRYTPDNYEKAILIQRIGQYFSYPERSEYRNKITKEVSDLLIKYSKHWTKHNVRVWFNNNRPNYISDLKNYNNYETIIHLFLILKYALFLIQICSVITLSSRLTNQ